MTNSLYKRLKTNKVEYKLTILILSLPNRLESLSKLLSTLNKQIASKPIQVLYLGDNKSITVGEKRNAILSLANGRYIGFIDDDDEIAKTYIDDILEAIESNPEVITFNVDKYEKGEFYKGIKYYLNNGNYCRLSPDGSHYKMNPNHLCVWRRDILKEEFQHIQIGEDHRWGEMMTKHYSTTHNIDKVLYYYKSDKDKTETRR